MGLEPPKITPGSSVSSVSFVSFVNKRKTEKIKNARTHQKNTTARVAITKVIATMAPFFPGAQSCDHKSDRNSRRAAITFVIATLGVFFL